MKRILHVIFLLSLWIEGEAFLQIYDSGGSSATTAAPRWSIKAIPRLSSSLPAGVQLQKPLVPGSESFGMQFFSVLATAVKCGGSPLALFQPSPCIVVAEDKDVGNVGIAQLSRIGAGYLYLNKDFELKQCCVQDGLEGKYSSLPISLIQEVLISVPNGNAIWAIVPKDGRLKDICISAGFAETSVSEAFGRLWPSGLFLASPLFLATVVAAGAIIGLPLLPFAADALGTDVNGLLASAQQIPVPVLLFSPAVVLILNVGSSIVGKSILKAEGQR